MPDTFSVGSVTAVEVVGTPEVEKKITAGAGGKLCYKTTSAVTTSDTEIAEGTSIQVETPIWLISASQTAVIVDEKRASTVGGGVISNSNIPGVFAGGYIPATAESGTDLAGAEKKLWVTSLWLPVNKVITGIGVLLGAGGGTDKTIFALFDSAGVKVANTSETTEGTVVGTEKTVQEIAFTSTYAADGPGLYFIGITSNGTTGKFRTIPANCAGSNVFAGEVALATKNTILSTAYTMPTTFTGGKGPICWVY